MPKGYIKYIIWHTDVPVEQVSLVNTKNNTEYTLLDGDFRHLERAKVNLLTLPKQWGCMYFCLMPYVLTSDTGGLVSSGEYYLKFPQKGSTTLWIMMLELYRAISGTFTKVLL